MGEPGKAMMGTAMARGPDRARNAAEAGGRLPAARGHRPVGRASGVLVLIAAAKGSLKLSGAQAGDEHHPRLRRGRRARDLRHGLRRRPGRPGARHRGRDRAVAARASAVTAPPLQVLRTGTDNVPFNVLTIRRGGPRARAAARVTPRSPTTAAWPCPASGATTAPRRGQGRCAVERRDGRVRDPGVPAQAGGLTLMATGIVLSQALAVSARLRLAEHSALARGQGCPLASLRKARMLKSRHAPATHPQVPDPGGRRRPARRPAGRADAAPGPAGHRHRVPPRRPAASRWTSRSSAQAVTDTRMASTISSGTAPRCTRSST